MRIRTLREAPIRKGTRVLVRADFDVVTGKDRLPDNFKIDEMLPTLRFLLQKGARVRMVSHLGRPHGKRVGALSMGEIASRLARLLGCRVIFISDPFARKAFKQYNRSSGLLFFENIRFWPGEENNDKKLAGNLARWADMYVNEAFANSHRKHASMAALPGLLPHFAGLRLEKEIFSLDKVIKNARRPLIAILGGAKLETKLPLIERFLARRGEVLLGGTLADTIFFAKGFDVGQSIIDKDLARTLKPSSLVNPRLHLPSDSWVARGLRGKRHLVSVGNIHSREAIFDIGPVTLSNFGRLIHQAKTVVWNGPLGLAEIAKFSSGTRGVARHLQRSKAFKVVGGSDTVAVLKKYKLLKGFDHVSTGGGAMLEFLAGKRLPGIEALKR